MTNYKTIKQLADEIGVSKTAINKKVNANFKRKHFKKNGNRFVIDEEGQKAIKSMFFDGFEEKRKPPVFENENLESQKANEVSDLVFVLKDRLAISDDQNNKKDIQIERLEKLLDQQQQLTLQANSQIQQLQEQLALTYEKSEAEDSEIKEDVKKEDPKSESEDKKWWHFLKH